MHTWALADVGKTSMWVQVASFGVESWQLLAVWPNRSSGVYWSDISRKCESGSIDVRQADKMQGTSLFQGHNSFSSLEARFRALRLNSTLQPKWEKGENYFDFFFDIEIIISAVIEKFDFFPFFRFLTIKLLLVRILINFFDFRTICLEKTCSFRLWVWFRHKLFNIGQYLLVF